MSRNSLSKYITRIFKDYYPTKNVTITMIRQLHVSKKFKGVKEEQEKTASNMNF